MSILWRLVVRDVPRDDLITLEQVEDAVLVLLQLIDVHVVEIVTTNSTARLSVICLILFHLVWLWIGILLRK